MCDPTLSTTTFSPDTGAICEDDGDPCLQAGVCSEEGSCQREPVMTGSPCGAGVTDCATSTCDGSGSCTTQFATIDTLCGETPAACYSPDHCDGGGACVAGDPLELGSSCGEHASCSGTADSPVCTCIDGFRDSGAGCVDIDECAEDTDDCDSYPDACVNETGSYHCACPIGFEGDGMGANGCTCPRDDYSPLCQPWTSVASSTDSSCAISDGALFCWGSNSEGQLGTGDTQDRIVPTQSGDARNWDSVTLGYDHACGIREGALYCWGDPGLGALGHGGSGLSAEQVGTAEDWSQVAAGIGSTCGIRAGGYAYCWGWNDYGQIGQGTTELYYDEPQLVSGTGGFTDISMGTTSVCAIQSGQLFCWGNANDLGSTSDPRLTPEKITDLEGWTDVSLYVSGGCALRDGGKLYCWDDSDSEPGVKLESDRNDWATIVADFAHTCGISQSGDAYCFGANNHGELGDGTTEHSSVPVMVAGASSWDSLAVGASTSHGIRHGGLYAWGSNENGRRGTGFIMNQVGSASDWVDVSTAFAHSCGIRAPGELYCWGAVPSAQEDNPILLVTQIGTALLLGKHCVGHRDHQRRPSASDGRGCRW